MTKAALLFSKILEGTAKRAENDRERSSSHGNPDQNSEHT